MDKPMGRITLKTHQYSFEPSSLVLRLEHMTSVGTGLYAIMFDNSGKLRRQFHVDHVIGVCRNALYE